MNGTHKKPLTPRRIIGILAGAAVLLCAIYYGANYLINTPSRRTNPPTDEIIALAQRTQYPVGTQTIVIRVTNQGSYSGELQKPCLETERNGVWYTVKRPSVENETSNLLYVTPGESTEWEIFLSAYAPALTPGTYRAVFDFVQSDEYFAFPFEIVSHTK